MKDPEKTRTNVPPLRQRVRKGLLILSFVLSPITFAYISCPIISAGASQGIVTAGLLVFVLLFFGSLFFGRIWCGFLCNMGGLQEIFMQVNAKNVRIGKLNWLKYVVFLGIFLGIAAGFFFAGGPQSIDLFYGTKEGISIAAAGAIGIFYGPIIFTTFFAMVFGKRGMCHYWCPVAVIQIIGRKIHNVIGWPALQIEADWEKCTDCTTCSKECPMSLDVNGMVKKGSMEHTECILCGSCVDYCPGGVISFSWTRKGLREKP